MKKNITLLLILTIIVSSAIALVSCNNVNSNKQLKIAYLNGPTGMGMAKL